LLRARPSPGINQFTHLGKAPWILSIAFACPDIVLPRQVPESQSGPSVAEIWAADFRHQMAGNIVNELI
jgi:hypothetical protein